MKIAVITCYRDPDYVRARSLRAALKLLPEVKPIVIKNKHRGLRRYPEIIWRIWQVRRHQNPDAYLLTFRGQEILPFVLMLAGRKPVFFDEFIVPIAYAKAENHKKSWTIWINHTLARLSEPFYRAWLRRCRLILADTEAHAESSARLSKMNLRKYLAVPVGTDEDLFKPGPTERSDTFKVFYYTTGMQPLHGIGTVLAAAEQLRDRQDIEFVLIGGRKPMARAVREAVRRGARISYSPWVDFKALPDMIRSAGICLGGPFGDTRQAHHVITGKTFQYLACAAPALVGMSQATAEYFEDKKNALVVPQADAAALVKAILWAQKHPEELKAIGQAGRKTYDKYFSAQAISQKLRRLVDEVS